MSNKILLEFIELFLEKKARKAHLLSGDVVEWGDPSHISELERQVSELKHRYEKLPKGSAGRADYRRAHMRLTSELSSAKKAFERRQLQEKNKTKEQAGD